MASKQTLERLNTTLLAVLCTGVAADPTTYTQAGANKARKLKLEWLSLNRPPEMTYREERKKKEKLVRLKKRMAAFLASIL